MLFKFSQLSAVLMRFLPFLPVLAILSTPSPEDEEAAALLLGLASWAKPAKRIRFEEPVVAEPWQFSLESAMGDYRSLLDGTYSGFHSTPDGLQMVMTGNPASPFHYSLLGPLLSQRSLAQTVFRALRAVNAEVEYTWDRVPKYSVDPNAPHRGLRQFWLKKRASEFNLCPAPVGISAAFRPASVADSRFSKALDPTIRAEMVRTGAIELLAVASPSVNLDLKSAKQLPGALSPALALKLGIAIVHKLEVLHQQARIVHGNLQPSAITMDNGTVGFRDFLVSRFLKPNNEPIAVPQRGEAVNLPVDRFSPRGPLDPIRDDLFRALTIVVWLTQRTDVPPPPAEALPGEWEFWRRANQFRMEGIPWNESFSNGMKSLIKFIHEEPVSESLYSAILVQLVDLVRLAQQA